MDEEESILLSLLSSRGEHGMSAKSISPQKGTPQNLVWRRPRMIKERNHGIEVEGIGSQCPGSANIQCMVGEKWYVGKEREAGGLPIQYESKRRLQMER